MYPAGELAVLRQLLFIKEAILKMVYSFIPRTENNLQEIGKNWILFCVVLYINVHQVFLVLGAHKSTSTSQ